MIEFFTQRLIETYVIRFTVCTLDGLDGTETEMPIPEAKVVIKKKT